jgi:hypothetical protein
MLSLSRWLSSLMLLGWICPFLVGFANFGPSRAETRAAGREAKAPSEDWQPMSPRAEIRPRFSFNTQGGAQGGRRLGYHG